MSLFTSNEPFQDLVCCLLANSPVANEGNSGVTDFMLQVAKAKAVTSKTVPDCIFLPCCFSSWLQLQWLSLFFVPVWNFLAPGFSVLSRKLWTCTVDIEDFFIFFIEYSFDLCQFIDRHFWISGHLPFLIKVNLFYFNNRYFCMYPSSYIQKHVGITVCTLVYTYTIT